MSTDLQFIYKGGKLLKEKREKVRVLLTQHTLTHRWLIDQLEDKGISVAGNELSEILAGKRKGKKAESVINTSLEVLNVYENTFAKRDS